MTPCTSEFVATPGHESGPLSSQAGLLPPRPLRSPPRPLCPGLPVFSTLCTRWLVPASLGPFEGWWLCPHLTDGEVELLLRVGIGHWCGQSWNPGLLTLLLGGCPGDFRNPDMGETARRECFYQQFCFAF